MRRLARVSLILAAALALPATALAGDVIDQSQESVSCGVGSGSADALIAQTFTAGSTGTITAVALHRSGGNAWNKAAVTIEIRDAVDGHPGTTVLATTVVKSGSMRWIKTSFRTGAAVTAGTQYAIVVHSDGTTSYDCAQHNPYTGGDAQYQVDSPWQTFYDEGTTVPWDLAFRTYLG